MRTCQYCGAPSYESFTCVDCWASWPADLCRCENNGDYCESCENWANSREELRQERNGETK